MGCSGWLQVCNMASQKRQTRSRKNLTTMDVLVKGTREPHRMIMCEPVLRITAWSYNKGSLGMKWLSCCSIWGLVSWVGVFGTLFWAFSHFIPFLFCKPFLGASYYVIGYPICSDNNEPGYIMRMAEAFPAVPTSKSLTPEATKEKYGSIYP